MAKDYSANPTDVKNFTSSAETTLPQSIQDYSEFLPAINRTESIQRFFGSTVNQLLSSGSTQSIDAYWGRLSGRNYNPGVELFNAETDATRLNYQFQPGVVSKVAGKTQQTVSYINWLKRIESLGADLDNHDRLFAEPGYVLDLPINPDMFINYRNYYWLEGNIPLIEIEATVDDPIDIDTITQVSHYTTPVLGNYRSVEFVTGLRVKFTGPYVTSTSGDYSADAIYYVENVGGRGGIRLVEIVSSAGANLFPPTTPYLIEAREGWDTVDWDTTPWDGTALFEEYNVLTNETRQDLALNKSYIVMQRWARDKNAWARSNRWFSVHALRVATAYNDLELEAYLNVRTRADRPIIEFRANMELYNTCKNFVELVDYVISLDQVTALLSGVPEFLVDSENALQNGDIILVAKEQKGGIEIIEYNQDFNNDFDSGETASGPFSSAFSGSYSTGVQTTYYEEAFIVDGVGTNITLIPYASYNEDDYVIVAKGTEKGAIYGFKDGVWGVDQNKDTRGTAPLFNLYTQFREPIEDFENNDFLGDKIFEYRINSAGAFDRELGLNPSFSDQGSFSNYAFDWSLSNNRYSKNVTVDSREEIQGYYYWRDWVEEEYYNGWSNIRGGQRVPVIQTAICDGVTQPEFELGTEAIQRPTEFTVILEQDKYRWYEHSYIDRHSVGYANPEFVWKYNTTYTINDLISVSASKLEFVDPYGNVDANITVNVVSDTLVEVTVNSSYAYSTVLYRNQSDPTKSGEIHLSDSNQKRVRLVRNGSILYEDVDYTITGSVVSVTVPCEKDDVIELSYIADADLDNAVYDVAPSHFYNNSNKPFTQAGYDDLINHFARQLGAMPGFEGNILGLNNYHQTLPLLTYDGLIRQQIFSTTNIQYLLDQENINPIRALKSFARDYSDFKRSFRNKVRQLWNTNEWNNVFELVDRALSDINIGKSGEFKYANSDMAYYKSSKSKVYTITDATLAFALPDLINKYGDVQNHVQIWLKEWDTGLGDYITRPLTKTVDYVIDGPDVILTTAAQLPPGNPLLSQTQLYLRWIDHRQYSHIPFSAVKLGFFKPTQVEVVDGILYGHDGSTYELTGSELFDMNSSDFDVVGAAMWDYELRVFNNLVSDHFVDDDMGQDMRDFYPNPVNEFAYTVADMTTRLDDWYNRWANRNDVVEIDEYDYDALDEFTWNYSTVSPNLGSWRSLYVYNFGTDRPHTHPWEMLGHFVKPLWWDTYYSWTAGPLRNALLLALQYGITGNAMTPFYVDIRYARSNYDWFSDVLVTSDGTATLNGPVTANVVAAPAPVDAAKNFVFGDWSEIENRWRKSSEYLFALAEVYLQLKPYRTHESFWTLDRWKINRNVTQEQWIDPQTGNRTHITELHNQLITDGVITKIRVTDDGSGYSYLNLVFVENPVPVYTASATAYTNAGSVVGVAVTNPGRGYNKDPNVALAGPVASSGVELEYTVDFEFVATHLGFNALPSEEYRVNTVYTNDLAEAISGLDTNYMLHVGGYTDKRILNIEIDGDYQSGLVRIPESSYDIIIDRNAPNQIVFYSGVKIEKLEGIGYRVDGYNLDSKFFTFLRPSTGGKSVAVTIGNTTVTKHLNWRNELSRIPYRSTITKRQELYQFLLGLGKYYESVGFAVYEQWEAEARAAVEWALSSSTEPLYVNGIADTIVFRQGTQGMAQTVDVNYDGVPNVLDQNYKAIRRNELLVLRDEDQTEYSLKNGEDRIYGLGVRVAEFEHIITIDNVTTFNDPIYQPEIGIGQTRVRLLGEKTRNWNGRIEAPGYIVRNNGLILNIESSVRELERDWVSAESKALERLTRQTIGYNVGYSKPTYMTNTFIGDLAAYRFEKGERKYKGTANAIAAMSRNKNIFGNEFAHELYEEWMVRLGDYGDKSERNPLQFAIDPNKIKSDPQHFRFNEQFVSDKIDDLIIDIHKGAADAVSGNYSNPFRVYDVLRLDNTSIQSLEEYQSFTRDAGLPLVDEIDYFLATIDDVDEIYNPTEEYARIPNWNSSAAYVQGDMVRRYGYVYRLLIGSTGLTNLTSEIIVRGTQVFPQVANGLTFIANGQTVTFAKTNTSVTYAPIVLDGSVSLPSVPSGDTLVIDGVNVNFIKTATTVTYGDIEIVGNVTNPAIVNSAGYTLTIGYANNDTVPLTVVTVNFNELDPVLTAQTIWINALTDAGATAPTTEASSRISALAALQTAYVGVNGTSAWETFIDNYYDGSVSPGRYVNPQYLGAQVSANPGAAWETAARALINLDLALITDIGGAHSETESTMVSGVLTNATTFNTARNAINTLLDFATTATDNNENLQDFRNFVEANGATTIANGQQISVSNPLNYVTDDVTAIANKISDALAAAAAPPTIGVSPAGNVITLSRVDNEEGYRLGVSTNVDLGFIAGDNDVETQGTTATGPVNLSLAEAVTAINNANITGVTAQTNGTVIRITSVNQSLLIGSSTANNDLGINAGNYNAVASTATVPVDLSIGDVVTQINAANIENLTASQVSGVLLITYAGDDLTIGAGTANEEIGLTAATYESRPAQVQNVFNSDDWAVVQDPAHFNIWTIDNIGSNPLAPATTTNRYDVYQTLDFNIGVLEICAGEERGDDALVKTDAPHNLEEGDYVLIVNSTCVPSVDGIHRVIGLLDDSAFFIDRYIEEKGYTGKMFPVRSVRFPNTTVAQAAMTNPDYVQGSAGLRDGDYVYVDEVLDNNSNSLGYGAVYRVRRTNDGAGLVLVRNENGKTDNSRLRNGVLYSANTGKTVIDFEVYDPLKGIIPGIADREIDIRSDTDLAYYNNTTDPGLSVSSRNAWGQERVGTVWWDLSKAIYLNYDQSTPEYRQQHWGELFPTASIEVYEWTKSPVTPDQYVSIVRANTVIDGVELTGVPYSVVDQYGEDQYYWSEEVELNPNTNQVETYFYFWVKNKTTTPNIDREYSVAQLADIIREPNVQNIDWIAATSENTLLVSSLGRATGYDDLVMKVNFDSNPNDYHQEFLLLAENDPATVIPEWLHISLRDSLAGFTQTTAVYEYDEWSSTTTYSPGRVVLSGTGKYYSAHTESLNVNPDAGNGKDYWTQLEFISNNPDGLYGGVGTVLVSEPKNIPDLDLHPLVRYGIETRPHQTWFKDLTAARRVAVDKINDQLKAINLVDSDIPWREEFERTFTVGALEYDVRDYWNFSDWAQEGFMYDEGVGDYFVETVAELNALNPTEGEYAHVSTSNDTDSRNRIQVMQYVDGEWVLVYKENATIQFSTLLWDSTEAGHGWDIVGWDTDEWDKSSSAVMVEIFDSFYYRIWAEERVGLYDDLWLHLAKHVLHEQKEVDWIFKSSYFKVIANDVLEKQYNKYFTENVDEFFNYIDEVKPFRSKMREAIVRKVADDDASITPEDTIEIRVQTNALLSFSSDTDEQNGQKIYDPFTRSFRLTVGRDGVNFSSQIVDDNKVLLGINIGPEDTIIPFLNNGVGTLPASGAFWINGERIEYTGQTNVSTSGIGSGFSSGFSTGFSGVTLLTGITRGTQGTFARAHRYADIMEGEIALTENASLSTYANTITPAWNELGDGLLDTDNANTNGAAIRGTTLAITNISATNPAVVTVADTSTLSTGMRVGIQNVVGMTEVNDRGFTITVLNGTTFELDDEDATGHTAYTSGGTIDNGDLFGTIEPYGNVLYAQWLAQQETVSAIEQFQHELEELIEVYWTQLYSLPNIDTTLITVDTIDYTVDGTKAT